MFHDIEIPEIDAENLTKEDVTALLQDTFLQLQNAIGAEKALYAFSSIRVLAETQPELFETVLSDENIAGCKKLVEKSKIQKVGIADIFSVFPVMQTAINSIIPNFSKFF